MRHDYDVIVAGVGGVGSAALYYAARAGKKVLGIERHAIGHDLGSSHGHTRAIRLAYFEHVDYVPLLHESYALWEELERECGESLYRELGLLEIGPPDGEVVPGVLASAHEHGLDIETLDDGEISRRFPGFRAAPGQVGVLEHRAGVLFVERCIHAYVNTARKHGAEVLENTELLHWQASSDGVRVATSGGEFTSEHLIIAGGAWAGTLLGELGLPLKVLRQSMFWYTAESKVYTPEGSCPVFLFETPRGVFYGFPALEGRGLKVAEHSGGIPVKDPAKIDREIRTQDQRNIEQFLASYLPGMGHRLEGHAACLYTMSPDGHFILDRHPSHPRVVFAAGLSGHGFKMVPVLGRTLVKLTCAGGTNAPIDFLSLRRF